MRDPGFVVAALDAQVFAAVFVLAMLGAVAFAGYRLISSERRRR